MLQVNYLVYPGTSGAPFLDFVIVDRVVVPPEHAGWFCGLGCVDSSRTVWR